MAFPWAIIAPIIGQLAYGLLFGGQGEQTATQETVTETPPTGFQDPGLGLLAPLLLGQLTQNVGRFQNFGFPAGGQMNTFMSQNQQSLLDLLQKEYEGISKEYGKPKEESYPDCVESCKKKYPGVGNEDFNECVRKCRETAGLSLPKKGTSGR